MKLSQNFSLEEFIVSDSYPELAQAIGWESDHIYRAHSLTKYFLQPLRNHLQVPVHITSGKRSVELNNAVGGSLSSDHLFSDTLGSCAVDITCDDIIAAWEWIKDHSDLIKYTYLWLSRNYIHISAPDATGKYGRFYEVD